MPKAAIFLTILLIGSFFTSSSHGYLGADLIYDDTTLKPNVNFDSGILKIPHDALTPNVYKRYLIFGSGQLGLTEVKQIHSVNSDHGFFSIALMQENIIPILESHGYHVIEDLQLEFHSKPQSEVSRIGKIVGSEYVNEKYGLTGKNVKIAIVDTGVDFSNIDIQKSLARDNNNFPIMLDSDGQGIVLTNATFIANIDKDGTIRNYTKEIPKGITSTVYKNKNGVFLDINKGGKGTDIPIYNSFFPQAGTSPIFNGTLGDDMKIGKDAQDYIKSKSGIYHLGVIYQGALQGPLTRLQVAPALVVDSKVSGVYDTIIVDMSTSWEDYTRFDLPKGQKPKYDFDFTDEKPIILGGKNEFLLYDHNKDGKNDYSAGTVGARVLDVYGAIYKKSSKIDPTLKAINGTLLPPMDINGTFFGIMTDFMGHGTSSAASIVSKGLVEYDIYNDTRKFTIKGVAPDATIVPVKSLWIGDSVYAWLWLAGFTNEKTDWVYSGSPRVDIISNSWGISNFPLLQSLPGMDILSLIQSVLSTPQSVDSSYPGIIIVSSAGNSGPGYGTIGTPNSAPFGITVGASTNNVFVGYGPFKGQPRFGNTTDHMNDLVDFSSRGPGIIGDPKPDLVSIGAHGFTPSSVIKLKKDQKSEPFSLFGGTSMAAPLVSGSAALLVQSMKENRISYDPFMIKNILMSTATDMKNDPFTQGSGLVNTKSAINYVKGNNEVFLVTNDASYKNLKKILDEPLGIINASSFGMKKFELPNKVFPQTSWFAGHLNQNERSTTTFSIENPTNNPIEVTITPQYVNLIKNSKMEGQTLVNQRDSIFNKSGVFAPNYIRLSDVKPHKEIGSFYGENNPIPKDSSLLVLNLNFPFDLFMNKTAKTFADDMKIASLYAYDWIDKNNDTKITSDEISMINRGGSWGTVQELRISEPDSKFSGTPVVGVYPVPTRYSYWLGDTTKNSTSMNYTLSATYYSKDKWDILWTSAEKISIPPKSSKQITATIVVPPNYQTGVYQGFLNFQSEKHSVNAPVSFVVKNSVTKDSIVIIDGKNSDDVLYGNGYIKGSFDMVNRYTAGDWRQYYFEINDPSINVGAIEISWNDKNSNLGAFVSDPKGRIVQTNMPSGVFGHFMGWPSIDWLGTTPFSQGGGFFPVKNKNETSTVLYVPINQTGTYSLLVHSTLFGGNSTTEPIKVSSKFTSLTQDIPPPEILLDIPEYVNSKFEVPIIIDENLLVVKYFIDNNPTNYSQNMFQYLEDGSHELKIELTDVVGKSYSKNFIFSYDDTPPQIMINSPKNSTTVSNFIHIEFEIKDSELPQNQFVEILLPNGKTITDQKSYFLDTSGLANGIYDIQIVAKDKANNTSSQTITFTVDHSVIDKPKQEDSIFSLSNPALFIGIIIGLAIGIGSILVITKSKKS